ncbi:P-loop containing nucleoside triphosphate hydrolase protein [Xylaria sp. FL1042]|nr:P-loop containing nucleoside triphosphate hydrolase protein [Xylaria sp. FL1042]
MVREARHDQLPPDISLSETSKIRALIHEIRNFLPEKSIVFSFWTSSLTFVQKALTTTDIRCVRIDGSLSLSNRERTIQAFREDEEIKVILMTISCGGVGLDLTAASRVHLLEPQWNPAIEEQALSRVHRMGQRRPVVTMRYVVKDSTEESVASVKGKKQLLMELLPQTALAQQSDKE